MPKHKTRHRKNRQFNTVVTMIEVKGDDPLKIICRRLPVPQPLCEGQVVRINRKLWSCMTVVSSYSTARPGTLRQRILACDIKRPPTPARLSAEIAVVKAELEAAEQDKREGVSYPPYARVGPCGPVVRHTGSNVYFRDAGIWTVVARPSGGQLYFFGKEEMSHVKRVLLLPATEQEWCIDNAGYLPEE